MDQCNTNQEEGEIVTTFGQSFRIEQKISETMMTTSNYINNKYTLEIKSKNRMMTFTSWEDVWDLCLSIDEFFNIPNAEDCFLGKKEVTFYPLMNQHIPKNDVVPKRIVIEYNFSKREILIGNYFTKEIIEVTLNELKKINRLIKKISESYIVCDKN